MKISLGDILSFGGAAAQFIPGGQAIAPLLTAGAGVLSGAEARRKADREARKIGDTANILGGQGAQMSAELQKLLAPLYAKIQSDALNYDPSSMIERNYRGYAEKLGGDADRAISNIFSDYEGRNLAGGTGLNNSIAQVRSSQDAAQGANMASLIDSAERERFSRLSGASGILGGALGGANDLSMGAARTMGGMQSLYASESDAFANSLSSLGEGLGRLLPKKGARGANAGNSTLATNQSPSPMFPAPSPGTFTYSGKPAGSPFRFLGG